MEGQKGISVCCDAVEWFIGGLSATVMMRMLYFDIDVYGI